MEELVGPLVDERDSAKSFKRGQGYLAKAMRINKVCSSHFFDCKFTCVPQDVMRCVSSWIILCSICPGSYGYRTTS